MGQVSITRMQGWNNEDIPHSKMRLPGWPVTDAPDAGEYVRSQA